jgi:hypothetical protein
LSVFGGVDEAAEDDRTKAVFEDRFIGEPRDRLEVLIVVSCQKTVHVRCRQAIANTSGLRKCDATPH